MPSLSRRSGIPLSVRARSAMLAHRHRNSDGSRPRLRAAWNARILRDPTAQLDIASTFQLGHWPSGPPNSLPAVIQMHPHSRLRTEGWFVMGGGASIVVGPSASLTCAGGDGGVILSMNSRIVCMESITIGEGAGISWDAQILDSDQHHISVGGVFRPVSAPVVICPGAMIGSRATVLKGVTVGEGAVVAAGAVVNKNVPPRTMVAGTPARVIAEDVEWY